MSIAVRAALAITILIFVRGVIEGFEPPKADVVRVLGLAVAGMALVSGSRWRRARWQPLDGAALVWLVVEALATAFSRAPRISFLGDRSLHEGLLTSLGIAGLYLGARLSTPSTAVARRTLDAIWVAMALACGYALMQAAHLDPFDWRRTASYGGGELRPFGTLGHPNLLGTMSAAALAGAAAQAVLATKGRWLYVVLAAWFALTTLLTLSRAAWLASASGLLVAAMLAVRAPPRPAFSARAWWMAAAGLALLILLVSLTGWGRLIGARLSELVSPVGGSGRSRLEIWASALAMWRGRPWFGQGPDTFALLFSSFQTPLYWRFEWGGLPAHAHSIYLHALATRGTMGLLAGTAWLAGVLHASHRVWRAGGEGRLLVPGFLSALFTFTASGAFGALGIPGAITIAILSGTLAALASPIAAPSSGPQTQAVARRSPRSARATPAPRAAWVGPAILAAPVLVWSILELFAANLGTTAFLRLQNWVAGGEAADPGLGMRILAVQESARALELMPVDDAHALLHSQCLLALASAPGQSPRLLDQAESLARRAIALAPLRAVNHQGLADVLTVKARRSDLAVRDSATRAWERHMALAPWDGLGMLHFARAQLSFGRPDQALDLAERAARLYPSQGFILVGASSVQVAAGDTAAAIHSLERALVADWQGRDEERSRARAILEALR